MLNGPIIRKIHTSPIINQDDFLEKTVEGIDSELVFFKTSYFKFNLTLGNSQGIEFLLSILNCQNVEVVKTPLVRAVVKYL